MKLNQNFITNIHEIYGEQGRKWLEHLPENLAQICKNAGLEFLHPVPNLSYNFVGVVKNLSNDETAVIKLAPTHTYLENEAKCLQAFTHAVPKIFWFDEDAHAFLMERIVPGTSLKQFVREGKDDEATRIICQVILNLQQNQKQQIEFKHVRVLGKQLDILTDHVDKYLLSKAQTLFHELSADAQDVTLHGDLHHDNILASGSSWKVIDPHGYTGDPVFEVGSLIVNPFDCFPQYKSLPQIIERRLKILSENLPFDPQRISAWAFCKTVLSVAWTFEDHKKIDVEEMEIARIISKIMK